MSTPEKILYSIFYKINSTDKNYSLESIKLTQETTIEQLKESILDILKDKLKKDNLYDIYFNSNESNEGILLNDSTDKLTVGELDKQLADKKIKNKDSIFILPQNKSVNESNSEDPDFVTAQEPPQTDEENKTVIVTPEQEQEQEQEQDKEKTGVPEGTVGIVTPEQEKTASLEKENTVPLDQEKENTVQLEKENTVPLEKENTAASLDQEKENTVPLDQEKENTAASLDQEKENTAVSLDQEKENTVPLEKENTVPLEKENTAASLEEEEKEEKAEEPGTTLSNDQLYAICAQLVYDARLSLTLSKKLFEKINNNEEILAKFTEINDSLDSLYKDQIFSQISDENQKFYKPVSSIDNAIDKAIEDNSFEGATPTSIIVLTIAQLAALAYGSAVMMGGKKKKTKGRKPRSQKPNKKTKRYLKQK